MSKTHCKIHPDTKLIVITYCPKCRGQRGGAKTAKRLTAAERKKRARKAAKARWGGKL